MESNVRDLQAFFAQNMKKAENVLYAATERLRDPETGEALLWEIAPITAAENLAIRRDCMRMTPLPGRKNQYSQNVDTNRYLIRLAVRCTEWPNLNDPGLQDSYNVKSAEQLLGAMLLSGELDDYLQKVSEVNGFDKAEEDREAGVAYWCLHKFHWPPGRYLALDPFERAFVRAAIGLYAEAEQRETEKARRQAGKR